MKTSSITVGPSLLLAALGVGLGLSGCATMSGEKPVAEAALCGGAGSAPTIAIGQLTVTSPTTATVVVTPGTQSIGTSAATLHWNLGGSGYALTQSGIDFTGYNNPSIGPGANGRLGANNYYFCFGSTASAPNSSWSYSIQLQDTSNPGTVWKCDPRVVNEVSVTLTADPQTVNCVPAS